MIDFVNESFETIEARMIADWEARTERSLHPASPARVMLAWFAAGLAHAYEQINNAANQNLLSGANGEKLDALAEIYGSFPRPQPKAAITMMVFSVNEAAASDILIPSGTMVSDASGTVVFATSYDVTLPAGSTSTGPVLVTCTQTGTVGNDYAIGQINRIYGGFSGVDACTNTSPTQQGRDEMSDEAYRAYLKDKLHSFSVAGPRSGYEYVARSANERISEVCVVTPSAGEVEIYALIDDKAYPATIAPDGIKAEILAACNADRARPLTDHVSVKDGAERTYSIEFVYYVRSDVTMNSSEIDAAIQKALDSYKIWQAAKFGRDINPSKLTQMLMETELLTRVTINSPVFTALDDGSGGNAPEHARCIGSVAMNGGVEDA